MSSMDEVMAQMFGCSVTQRIKQVDQPKGGYIKPKEFKAEILGEGMEALNPAENVSPILIGLAVDYMTRFMAGASAEDAFEISLKGASRVDQEAKASKLLSGIKGLDDRSIVNALKLVGFDVCFRNGGMGYKPVEEINADAPTVQNVRTMVERSLHFFEVYGPKVLDGFSFEGGYTDVVCKGDGDFTTADTLWDFKVSKTPIKKEHTLQLLMYWRMGLHSIHPEFKDVKYLGIYNPRMNTASRIAVEDISDEVIKKVEKEVIGYEGEIVQSYSSGY